MVDDRRYIQTSDPFVAADLNQMLLAPRYNQWLYSLVMPFLGKRILEVGAGVGTMTKQFIGQVEFVMGVEPNQACVDYLKQSFSNYQNFHLHAGLIQDIQIEELSEFRFDTVLCINVLEHIEDDHDVLKTFSQVLQTGGKMVLFVPAVPWAFGVIDKSVGHFRRYQLRNLRKLLEEANFRILAIQYSNFPGLLGWFFNAHILKITMQNNAQIKNFDRLVPFISRLESVIHPPLGMSLLAIGEKT